jgi:hypothetical protein
MQPKKTKRVSYRSTVRGEEVPCLIIQGKFLNAYGFKRGDDVAIEYRDREIAISNK